MPDTPPGFGWRVIYGAKSLPYPVTVVLPPGKSKRSPSTPLRTRGPILDLEPPNVPERHTLLGKFMDEWSLLERMLHFFMAKLIETDLRTTNYVMNTLGIKQIIDLIAALATLKLSADLSAQIINLMERVSRLNSKRNILVHGHWILEAVILVDNGDAIARTQYLRVSNPPDPKIAELVANPKNQKERVKYTFTLKRISGAARDVSTLSMDLAKTLQETKVSLDWTKQRSKLLSKSEQLDILWSMHQIDPIPSTLEGYNFQPSTSEA